MRWVFGSVWLWWFVAFMSSVWDTERSGKQVQTRGHDMFNIANHWVLPSPFTFTKTWSCLITNEREVSVDQCVWTTIAFALQLTTLSEGQMMRVKQFELFREDIRDLMNLTVGKMDNYLIVTWWWTISEARFGAELIWHLHFATCFNPFRTPHLSSDQHPGDFVVWRYFPHLPTI